MPLLQSSGHPDVVEWVIAAPSVADVSELRDLAAGAGRNTTSDCWRGLMLARNVMCATSGSAILGVYAANVIPVLYEGDALRERIAALNILRNRLRLANSAIGFGTLTAIRRNSPSELRLHLLRSLLRGVGFRYRYLFSATPKSDNDEVKALANESWRCFHEEDHTSYMMLDVARCLRDLATRLVLPSQLKPVQVRAAPVPQESV